MGGNIGAFLSDKEIEMRLIEADDAIARIRKLWIKGEPLEEAWEHDDYAFGLSDAIDAVDDSPTIEPNLILPERMGRGDIYEVGETIVVMNHDDYYDLLCKSWMPKRGEWIEISKEVISIPIKWSDSDKRKPIYEVKFRCSECGFQKSFVDWHTAQYNYCPNCGARMKGADDE